MADPVSAAASEPGWLRPALITAALVEAVASLSGLTLFSDLSGFGNSPGQWMIFTDVALKPLLALTALVFAIRRDWRHAVIALAALPLATMLLDSLPSLLTEGVQGFGEGLFRVYLLERSFLLPLACAWAAWLAWNGKRLALAALIVIIPTVLDVVEVAVFTIGIAIYGF
ncbi:MAG: hypothetical protein VX871_01555 [Pseudomonadota bacterium]|nr:hypothetical protein [Pseudomonadota bacterium]